MTASSMGGWAQRLDMKQMFNIQEPRPQLYFKRMGWTYKLASRINFVSRTMLRSFILLWFQFSRLLSSTEGPHTSHLNSFVTVFAPTNAAMETYTGARDLDFILNHFGEIPPRGRQAERFLCFDISVKQRKLHPTQWKLNNVKMFSLLVSTSISPEEIGGNHRLSSLRVGQPPLWVRYVFINCWNVKRIFLVFCL